MPAYRDKKTGSWYVKFRCKNWKNETKNVTKRGFCTKREALCWEREYLEKQAGSLDMTMEQFVEVYFEDLSRRIKESTLIMKKNIIETKIIPFFKDKRVNEITTRDVVKWQNELLEYRSPETGKGYSKSYLKTVHNQLSAIFNHAVRYYRLNSNPACIVGNMGSEKDIHMKYWVKEQYLKFSEAIMDDPIAYYCFQILYWCGIREGELLALTADDFDFNAGTLTISKTYHRIGGEDVITSPKTPKSYRTITVPETLCKQIEDYISMSYGTESGDRLFPVNKYFLIRKMEKGAKAAGVPRVRIHDLRHSHVSLLIDMGYSAAAIADRMGHESIDITYRYAHLFPTVQKDMADKLDGTMGG